jgi:hypothetical protein
MAVKAMMVRTGMVIITPSRKNMEHMPPVTIATVLRSPQFVPSRQDKIGPQASMIAAIYMMMGEIKFSVG